MERVALQVTVEDGKRSNNVKYRYNNESLTQRNKISEIEYENLKEEVKTLKKGNEKLEKELEQSKEKIESLIQENKKFQTETENFKKEIAGLMTCDSKLEEVVKTLKNGNDKLANELKQSNEKIENLTQENKKSQAGYENLYKEKSKLEEEVENLKNENDKLEQNLQVARAKMDKEIKELITITKKLCKERFGEPKDHQDIHSNELIQQELDPHFTHLKSLVNTLQKQQFLGSADERWQQRDQVELYDTIIKTKSFFGLKKGWKIHKSDNEEAEKRQSTVVSTIGNFNKGKTWLLSFLSERILPTAFNIHTKGVSCIYPPKDYNPITYLDSAGFDEALNEVKYAKKVEEFIQKYSSKEEEVKNDEQHTSVDEKEKKIKIQGEDGSSQSNSRSEQNNKTKEQQSIKDWETSRFLLKDKLYIEHFIQNFLLDTADVILIVVSQLTLSDQKLIKRIQETFKKTIFIVHNFSNLLAIDDVKKYIKEDIIGKFRVEPKDMKESSINKGKNLIFYVDKANDHILHIVMAREGTEAGDYYNQSAKNYIEHVIEAYTNKQRKFIVEEELEAYLKKNILEYIETEPGIGFRPMKERIKDEKDGKDRKIWGRLKAILTKGNNQINDFKFGFKKAAVDECGIMKLFRTNGVQLPCDISEQHYETKTNGKNLVNKELVIVIEAPGIQSSDLIQIKPLKEEQEGFYFEISAKKDRVPFSGKEVYNEIFQSEIEYGEARFITKIITPMSKLAELELKQKKKIFENGRLIIRIPLKSTMDEFI